MRLLRVFQDQRVSALPITAGKSSIAARSAASVPLNRHES
jgi:hypothetical protein